MKRDSMGLGPDALTLYCDAGHGRLDMAFVDVSGEPETWRGFVHKQAVEANPHQPGLFANEPSDYYSWAGQIRDLSAGGPNALKQSSLDVKCSRCRKGRLPHGRTLRVSGGLLHEFSVHLSEKGDDEPREVSLVSVERYMRMRGVVR
jgi:hypothetical protein